MSNVTIKSVDMPDEMKQDAIEIAKTAFESYQVEKDIAGHIKKEFDKKYEPVWHCIVGKSFGSYVTHENNRFIYFYVNQNAVLLFKVG